MEVTEYGLRIYLLGDPHLGRSFVHGVPLHRRGAREQMVWQDFLAALDRADVVDLHICLGDLFDKWIVSFDLILAVAAAYKAAAAANPNCRFYVVKGNHDWTRDLERRSAFDVFAALVAEVPNIKIVKDIITLDDAPIVIYPWHPLWVAKEKLANVEGKVLVGHFDIEFGEHNMVPTELAFERIYTGHDHKARTLNRHGTEVIVVGSMQPYAHGEEGNEDLYITLTPEQIVHAGDLSQKCVRVIGHYEGQIDCLQLTLKQEQSNNILDVDQVTLGDFNMEALFAEAFAEVGVSAERTADILAQYQTKRITIGA